MTTAQARREVVARLATAGIGYGKIQAKSVNFGDLARGGAIFVEVYNPTAWRGELFADIPASSNGGYIVKPRGSIAGQPIF